MILTVIIETSKTKVINITKQLKLDLKLQLTKMPRDKYR